MATIRTALLAAGLCIAAVIGTAQNRRADGHWEGKIQVPNHPLSITIDLARNNKGEWAGFLTVVGSTTRNVPLSNITVGDVTVRFNVNMPDPVAFDGGLSVDGTAMSGMARSAAFEAPFELTRTNEPTGAPLRPGKSRTFAGD